MPKVDKKKRNTHSKKEIIAKKREKVKSWISELDSKEALNEDEQKKLKELKKLAELKDEEFANAEVEEMLIDEDDVSGDDDAEDGSSENGDDNPDPSQSTDNPPDVKMEDENEEPTPPTPPATSGRVRFPNNPFGWKNKEGEDKSEDEDEGEDEELLWGPSSRSAIPCETLGCTYKERLYLNRYGARGAAMYRLEPEASPPDFTPRKDQIVSNMVNQIGTKRGEDGKYFYTKRHICGIYGVAIKSGDLDTINPRITHERLSVTYVLVGWRLDLTKEDITKCWETRSTLRRLWGRNAADERIFKAALKAQKRYENDKENKGRGQTADLMSEDSENEFERSSTPFKPAKARAPKKALWNLDMQPYMDNTGYIERPQQMQQMPQMQQLMEQSVAQLLQKSMPQLMEHLMPLLMEQMMITQLPRNGMATPLAMSKRR